MSQSPVYSRLDGLLDMARRDGVDIRQTLLRVLTDLYVQKRAHSPDEETQYVELALALIDVVDASTHAAIHAKLSGYAAAPPSIMQRLAERSGLTNASAPKGTAGVSKGPTAKADVPSGTDLVELFFAAGADERSAIISNLDATDDPRSRPLAVTGYVIGRLETAILQGNIGEFTRLLGRALTITHELADRISRDESGEPIVLAAKALGMPLPAFQRILLFINPSIGHSVERVQSLSILFDQITPEMAIRMLRLWRQAARTRAGSYEPFYSDRERRIARPAAAGHSRSGRSDIETGPTPSQGTKRS